MSVDACVSVLIGCVLMYMYGCVRVCVCMSMWVCVRVRTCARRRAGCKERVVRQP